jgi:hypothetical protein
LRWPPASSPLPSLTRRLAYTWLHNNVAAGTLAADQTRSGLDASRTSSIQRNSGMKFTLAPLRQIRDHRSSDPGAAARHEKAFPARTLNRILGPVRAPEPTRTRTGCNPVEGPADTESTSAPAI